MGVFDDIEKIDDSPDLVGVIDTVKNQNKYKIQLINELLEKTATVSTSLQETRVKLKETVVIGPELSGPSQEKWQMVQHLKEEFLKNLDRGGFLEKLSFFTEDIEGGRVFVASFSYMPSVLVKKLKEIKRSFEQLTDSSIVPTADVHSSKTKDHTPQTDIIGNNGYLIYGKEKILIGGIKSGKFRLVESLCNPHFGVALSIDEIFDRIAPSKRKTEPQYTDSYTGRANKLGLIRGQFKEIQRIISKHGKKTSAKIKNVGFALQNDGHKVWFR